MRFFRYTTLLTLRNAGNTDDVFLSQRYVPGKAMTLVISHDVELVIVHKPA